MQKNVAGQKLTVFAFDRVTGAPKTGDAANITAYVSKDDGAVTVLGDTSAAEKDATNAPGYYTFDLTQAETNANKLDFSAKSATAGIVVMGSPPTVFTRPPNFQASAIDSNGVFSADLAAASVQKVTGYTTIINVATTDNVETIIEGAAAGTLIRLAPGTHTRNAEIAVPSGVTIMGAGIDQTILTGDPGDGTNALLRFNGTNEISDLKIVNVNDGHGIATTLSGVAGFTIMRRIHVVGKQDCIGIQPPASGYAQFLIEDSIIDCSHWDGLTIITGDVHGTVRNTEFRAFGNGAGSGHKAIFITTFTGSDINITVDNCVCNSDAALNATNALIFGNDAGGGVAKVSVFGTTHSGPMAFLAGNSAAIQYEDRGGNNIYQFANALTGGSAVVNIPAAAANAAVVAGTVGTNAATAATQSTTAATQSTTAATQATAANTIVSSGAHGNAALKTAVDGTPAASAAAVIGATAAGAAGTVGKILADYAAVKPATTIAAAEDVDAIGGPITRADADMVAARVNASRGEFYPNRNQVWVLKRTDGGVTVKNDFAITKKAGESLKVWVDFAGILGRNEAVERIESIDLDSGTATIVVDSEEIVGNLVAVTLTGGAADDVTTLNLEVLTTEDQTITVDACTMNVVE